MPKGNRTKSGRNTAHITELNRRYKEDLQGYKEFAEARRRNRVFRQEDLKAYHDRLFGYIGKCKEHDEPITRAGMMLAMEIDHSVYYRILGYEYDYRLYEYIDVNNISDDDVFVDENGCQCVLDGNGETVLLIPYSEILQKAELMLEEQTELRLYKSGKVGDIFALKALHGWQDSGQPQVVNQNLVIASPEQAKEAIALLG